MTETDYFCDPVAKGEVGSWEWAETAEPETLRKWLETRVNPKDTQHVTVLVKVGERLKLSTEEMVDIIYAE